MIVDGRGSANRGVQFEANIKGRMGSVEIEDQVEGLQVVAEQSQLLDLDRVAVMGWLWIGVVVYSPLEMVNQGGAMVATLR